MITYYAGQYQRLAEIFIDAITVTALEHYSLRQCKTWAGNAGPISHWRWHCELKRPFLCMRDGEIAGFAELDPNGHIDRLYTHPDYNRQGVGSELLQHLICIAKVLDLSKLFVEASHCAKGLFEKHGFLVTRANTVTIKSVAFENWLMELPLDQPEQ